MPMAKKVQIITGAAVGLCALGSILWLKSAIASRDRAEDAAVAAAADDQNRAAGAASAPDANSAASHDGNTGRARGDDDDNRDRGRDRDGERDRGRDRSGWREGWRRRYWRWSAEEQAAATRPTTPFMGTYSDDRISVAISRKTPADTACTGTITLGDRDRPAKRLAFSGDIHDGELAGKFQDGNGNAFPFSARMQDQNLVFRTGAATYLLTDDSLPRPNGGYGMRWGPGGGGVGMYFEQTNDGSYVITMVRPNGPAARSGLQTGDVVLKIDDVDLSDLELEGARRLVIGRTGTEVKFTIRHRDGNVENYKIMRQRLQPLGMGPPPQR